MRRLLVVAAASLALAVAAACDPLAPPSGPAPLRYRDDIFTHVSKTADVVYGSAVNQGGEDETLLLDVYEPVEDNVTSRPAIIWVHGGGFSGGSKTSPELVDQAHNYARKGYVNVSIDYRLAPTGCIPTPGPSCLIAVVHARQDAQTAVRYLRANAATYGIDATRIAIGGSSAGAITALNVGYNAETPGPGDHQGYSSAVRAVQSLSGGMFNLATINAGDAPALLFHGTADVLVPYSLAQATVDEAKTHGLVAILRTWQGGGHVPYAQNRTQILDETRNFFYSQMDLAHAAR